MKKYKFDELSRMSKDTAIAFYITGWLDSHSDDPLTLQEAEKCCLDDDDTEYDKRGFIFEDEEESKYSFKPSDEDDSEDDANCRTWRKNSCGCRQFKNLGHCDCE